LSPFPDDQDDSDQSDSCATSDPHFTTFETLTSLVDFDDCGSHLDSDSGTECITGFPHNPLYQSPFPSSELDLSPSFILDEDDDHSHFSDEDLHPLNLSVLTGDVVFDSFFQELRRTIPEEAFFEFNTTCLREMDSRLLLEPGEVFNDICWAEISQLHHKGRWKPFPDVPSGFADDENPATEVWNTVRCLN